MELSINWYYFTLGLVELILTFVVSILVVFLGQWVFSLFTNKIKENQELKKNNISVGIILASVIISMAIIIKSAVNPSVETVRELIRGGISFVDILISISFFLMFFIISGVVAIFIILLSSFIYSRLTKSIEEFDEIKNNNIAVAIVLGAVIISISFIVQDGVAALMTGLMPYSKDLPKTGDIPKETSFYIENSIKYFLNCVKLV